MLQNLFSTRHFQLTKWSFLVHSTTRYALEIHPTIRTASANYAKFRGIRPRMYIDVTEHMLTQYQV